MDVAESTRVVRRRRHGPPTDGWWGNGMDPADRWPGTTIRIKAVWVPLVGTRHKWERDEMVWRDAGGEVISTWWGEDGGRWESPDHRYYFDRDEADRACDFFSFYLTHHIGEFAGQPFELLDYQRLLLTRPLFGWKRASDDLRRFRKVFGFLPKGSGKALALNTPIPTPAGWSRIGDIAVGDDVFDDQGRPTRVVAVSDILHERQCYRVGFDDGSSIIADAQHLWSTEQREHGDKYHARALARRHGVECWKHGVRSTETIAKTLRYSNGKYQSVNHSIPLAGTLNLPARQLPVEPYTLGIWLGDGDSDCARVTIGAADLHEMAAQLEATGTDVSTFRHTNSAFRMRIGSVGVTGPSGSASANAQLRLLGLFGNKHVPQVYLRASAAQRRSLLQGLMDSDGSIDVLGHCEFCSTVPALAEGVLELLRSLSIKAAVRENAATLRGRVVGRRWRITFSPPPDQPVFRLARKLARQRWRHYRRRLSSDHRIVSCEPVVSVPVRCITIDAPSRLYLAGRSMIPTHNSPWGAGTGLYCTLCDREPAAEVYAVAADKDQARTVHDNAKIMVEESGDLSAECEVWRDSIYHPASRSTYKVVSSDAATKHGFRPHVVIFDEFHAQKNRDLYEALKKSMPKRRQPIMIMITHAGDNDEGICFEEYEYAKRVLSGTVPDDSCLPVIFEMSKKDDWRSPAVWRRVNPGHGITVKEDGIATECLEAQSEPRKLNDFLRFHGNRWVNQATAWIPLDWWDACEAETSDAFLLTLDCAAGLDLAQKWDLAAFVVGFREYLTTPADEVQVVREETTGALTTKVIELNYRLYVRPFFWIPQNTMRQHEKEDGLPYSEWVKAGLVTATEGDVIDYTRIYRDITEKIVPRFPKLKQSWITYDPAFATDLAGKLNKGGLKVVELLQNYKQLSEPSQIVEALIKGKRVVHDGNRTLRNHWENIAIKTDDAGRIRPVKPRRSAKRIDGAVATIMANAGLSLEPPDGEKQFQMFILGPNTKKDPVKEPVKGATP